MSGHTTRRTISLRCEVYERIRKYCAANDIAVAAFAEQHLKAVLDAAGFPEVPRDEALARYFKKPKPAKQPEPPDHGHHFTF